MRRFAGCERSEATVQNGVAGCIRLSARVVVTVFRHNLAASLAFAEIAFGDSGRTLEPVGSQLLDHMHSAGRAQRYLNAPPGFIGPGSWASCHVSNSLWICTGSQGEPAAGPCHAWPNGRPFPHLSLGGR